MFLRRRASLRSFLAAARGALSAPASQRPAPLTLVVGNESADLDSLCCAIVYAYLRSHQPPPGPDPGPGPGPGPGLYVPLANLPRADLGLRPELTAVLAHAGLRPADLVTLSELPELLDDDYAAAAAAASSDASSADASSAAAASSDASAAASAASAASAAASPSTRWMLVDHNALTGPLARFAPRVVGCVDHHVDDGGVPAAAAPRVIGPCGSCMSLVVDETRQAWDALTARDARGDDALARLGLAPVLVDTANLAAAEKVRPKDERAVAYLEAKLSSSPGPSRAAFFDAISAAKEDVADMPLRDLFRRDYKQWSEGGLVLGVSCVVRGLAALVDAAGGPRPLLDALSAWAAERRLDVAAVMTTSAPDGRFRRHLLVWGRTPAGDAAAARFADAARAPLRLETWRRGELDRAGSRFAWRQGELAASRKQVGPLLREAMKTA